MKPTQPNQLSLFEDAMAAMGQTTAGPSSPKAGSKLVRRKPSMMALEQRFMFDGAGVGDVVSEASKTILDSSSTSKTADSVIAADKTLHLAIVAPAGVVVSDAVLAAKADAEKLVADFLARSDTKEQLFTLFNGGKTEPDAQWNAAFEQLMAQIESGSDAVRVELRAGVELQGAKGAFSATGTTGQFTIYLNSDWLAGTPDVGIAGADRASIETVLVEEMGHFLDATLNAGADTAGDEGEIFSRVVISGDDPQSVSFLSAQDDHATLQLDGQNVRVELASFNFVNAYQMVYDLNNNTNSLGVVGAAIDTNERWADKEQNSHFFNTTGLGAVAIDDNNYNTRLFSGNDVSAIGLNIGGTDYYGWVSRPIKSGGVVRGFYFWTDTDFVDLATAQADGNRDTDSSVLDNKGFLLVVDQTWFTSQITSTGVAYDGTTKPLINNTKDGNLGSITVANLGSSSDRVDSALNALVDNNVAPVATDETASGAPSATPSTGAGNAAREEGYNSNTPAVITTSLDGSGNVLANETDANNTTNPYNGSLTTNTDTLIVTKVVSKATGGSTTATSAGATLVGKYGTLTIQSDGDWTYDPDDTNPAVNTLLGGSLQEQFTYTVSDGKGGTDTAVLTVQINGSNDAPVAVDDYNTAKETTTSNNTGYTATAGVLPDVKNLLANDTDVDTGDGKTISGASVSGSTNSSAVTVTTGGSELIFLGSQGFTSVNGGEELYVLLSGSAGNSATYQGVYNLSGSTYSLVYVSSKTAVSGGDKITLNAEATHYWNGTSYVAITSLSSFFSTYPNVLFENSTTQTENGSGGKQATVSSIASSGYTTLSGLSAQSGTIAVGMTVTGTGVPSGTTVSDITLTSGVITSIKLSSDQVTSNNGTTFTFTGSSGTGVTLTGAHGSVVIATDGSYTYTPTNDNAKLSSGESAIEIFDYTMQDTAGVTSSAKLYITVYGSDSNDPSLTVDSVNVYESGVGRDPATPATITTDKNAIFLGQNVSTSAVTGTSSVIGTVTYNVLSNDTRTTGDAVADYTKSDGTGSPGVNSPLTATYGSLTITSAGAVTYTINNANAAVNALLPGSTLTETFRYKVANSAGGSNWSTLTITIQGTNDAPVAVVDLGSALTEDSVLSASGNVLTNDTDVDSGDTKVVANAKAGSSTTFVAGDAVSTSTTSANGLAVGGTYGTLTIGADGTYKYVLATSADASRYAALQALTQGSSPTETFTYQVKDTNGATSTTTLTFTVNGANEPPINNFNGTPISSTETTSVTTALNTALDFTGTKLITISDADNNLSSVILTVENGLLSFTGSPTGVTLTSPTGATITTGANITITGTQADINAAIALLRYTPTNNFAGTDYLTIASTDSQGGRDSDGIAINIPTVTTATVSEPALSSGSLNSGSSAESYSGSVTLAAGQTINANQTGSIKDGSNNNVGTWAVNTDGTFTVTLTTASSATSTSFTYQVFDSYGNSVNNQVNVTIVDDTPTAVADAGSVTEDSVTTTVTGNVITGTSSATADTSGADTPVTVVGVAATQTNATLNDPTKVGVNISGLYGTINIASNGAYTYTLDNTNSTVNALNNGGSLTDEIFTYTIKDADGDLSYTTVTITVNGATDTSAAFIVDDVTVNEAAGTLTFTVTNTGAAVSSSVQYALVDGTALVGSDYTSASGTLSFDASNTTRTVSVTISNDSPSVYEGSESFYLNLSSATGGSIQDAQGVGTILDDGTGAGGTDNDKPTLTIGDATMEEGSTLSFAGSLSNATESAETFTLSTTLGTAEAGDFNADKTTWTVTYVDGSSTTQTLNVNAAGAFTLPAGVTSFSIKIPTTADNVYEGAETFTLSAAATSSYITATDTGLGTITDDGTGSDGDDGGTDIDDDRPAFSVGDMSISEGGLMTFTVTRTGASDVSQTVDFATSIGGGDTAEVGDFTANNGTLTFAAGVTSQTFTVQSTADATYEGGETFTVTLSNNITGSTISDATGTGTILDDGSGPGPYGPDPLIGPDDNRPITVTGDTYNENSPRAIFTVNATNGQYLTLDVKDLAGAGKNPTGDNEGGGADELDTTPIYYSIDGGANWVKYDGTPFQAGNVPVLVAVDITPEVDGVYEGEEQLQLVVNPGKSTQADAFSSIVDDGTGKITDPIDENTQNPTAPRSGPGPSFDDDRPITVTGDTYNENSPRAIFTVNATNGQYLTLDVKDLAGAGKNPTGDNEGGGADELDTTPIYYSIDGGANWVKYDGTPFQAGNVPVLVAVDITPEVDGVYEGEEQLQLVVNPGKSTQADAFSSIVDDGTGKITDPIDENTQNPTAPRSGPGPSFDDDRPLTVNDIEISESSPYGVFKVAGQPGQYVQLELESGTATVGTDTGTGLEYFDGTNWQPYTPGSFVQIPAGTTTLLVRVPIVNDQDFEGRETFKLKASNTGGSSALGTAGVYDDGSQGQRFEANNNTGTPTQSPANDDRNITVTGLDDVSEGSNAIFTVTLPDGNVHDTDIDLGLSDGTATDADYSSTFAAYYYNGSTRMDLTITNGKITLPAGVTTFYVSVPTTQDNELEGAESFKLTATITGGKSANDDSTIVDDGSGQIYDEKGQNPTGPGDDDTPKPPPPPPVIVTEPDAPPPPPIPTGEFVPPPPAKFFVPEPVAVREVLTSSSGFRVAVVNGSLPSLTMFNGIDDQFVESVGSVTSFALPSDAFAHTQADASVTLDAKMADGSNLPSWVAFDGQAGVFRLTPPEGFRGELEIKVIARDNEGREAEAKFKLNVAPKVQKIGRESLSEKLKLAARKDSPWVPSHELRTERTERVERHAAHRAAPAERTVVKVKS